MIDYLLCADWSKKQKGRALYAADVRKRAIYREGTRPLTFDSALKSARELAEHGNVLLSFDLPLGLPHSYLSTLCNVPGWEGTTQFLDFLQRAVRAPSFFESCQDASGWCVERPFFVVQKGEGGKQAFELAAKNVGVQLRRRIDELTKGNPLFITAGIPGSVGSGTIDAWRALARHLTPERDFKVWPFEGPLPDLFEATRIVMAENYPRAAYAAALSDLPGRRPRMRLAKTDPALRRDALDHLRQRPWFTNHGVTIHGEEEALGDENEFDALMTTAGLLRVLLEGEPLYDGELADRGIEGCILGTGTLDLGGAEQNFRPIAPRLPGDARPSRVAVRRAGGATPAASGEPRIYACPVPGCSKLFTGSRGGWDAHAGSLRNHPHWYPEVAGPEARRSLFRKEFPRFFS